MFRKPFKIKSNNQVKGSERKVIRDNFLKSFPNLTESELDDLLPKKEVMNSIKILTASDETVHVYTIQKCPMVFEFKGKLFPTIFWLWKFPNFIPAFTTHPQVLTFITSGADLMLPGVLTPPTQAGSKYGSLQEGATAYVNVSNNKAAVAVGVTAQSSAEMVLSNGRGKCVTIYHYLGDKLCSLDGISNQHIPNLGPPDWLKLKSYEEDFPELGSSNKSTKSEDIEKQSINTEDLEETDTTSEEKKDEITETQVTSEEMDELLKYCFFTAIKYSKTISLPILTSNFYKLQMMPICPEGKTLDIKKSSYKKLKPFLDNLSNDGVITIKEIKKGVESVTAINKDHPKFTEFYVDPTNRPQRPEETASSLTNVTESYIITPSVLPLFKETGLNKGDTVQVTEIRKHVAEYVKKHECQNEVNKKLVKPKEALIKICKTENNISWEELMEKVCESMKSCYKVSSGSGNEEILNRGKVSPITFTISQRSGNKKVTLIDNLELFGIKIGEFAKECQHGVAASTSISRPPGKKCDQLLVQGNQIIFINKLLTDKYKIPQKYIKGLENAPKKKK